MFDWYRRKLRAIMLETPMIYGRNCLHSPCTNLITASFNATSEESIKENLIVELLALIKVNLMNKNLEETSIKEEELVAIKKEILDWLKGREVPSKLLEETSITEEKLVAIKKEILDWLKKDVEVPSKFIGALLSIGGVGETVENLTIQLGRIKEATLSAVKEDQAVYNKIIELYDTYTKRTSDYEIQKQFPEDNDTLEWHKLFVLTEVRKLGSNDDSTNLNTFNNFLSTYGEIEKKPRPDQIQPLTQNKEEVKAGFNKLVDYSMALVKKPLYKSRVEAFKSQHKENKANEIKNSSAVSLLEDIKKLIEDTTWTTGSWGSRSKIEIEGKSIKVPRHIGEIYEKATMGINDRQQAIAAMEEITQIARRALDHKPTFFGDFRKRDDQTQKVYETIAQPKADF